VHLSTIFKKWGHLTRNLRGEGSKWDKTSNEILVQWRTRKTTTKEEEIYIPRSFKASAGVGNDQ